MKKSRNNLSHGWWLKAESDLADARRTIAGGEGPYDTACFHCQQAVEKYLKALLALHGKDIPKTHDIEELLILCRSIDPTFPEGWEAEQMSSYAVEMRYDSEFWPDDVEAKRAFAQAERMRDEIKKRLPGE